MKTYDTLYSKDSTGKIRIWFQQQDGGKYRTVSGVKDSDNLVTSEWTQAVGKNTGKKNETSDSGQASLEIEATYKKKLKTGYFKDIKDVDVFQFKMGIGDPGFLGCLRLRGSHELCLTFMARRIVDETSA